MSEYRNQRIPEDIAARSAKHRFAYSMMGLAAGLITILLLNKLVTGPLWQPELGQPSIKYASLADHPGKINTLFLGTSRINRGVVPVIYDAEPGAAGNSFNLGLNGATIQDHRRTIGYLQKDDRRFDHIVIEPATRYLPRRANARAKRTRDSSRQGDAWLAAKILFEEQHSLEPRLMGLLSIAQTHLWYLFNSGVLADLLLPPPVPADVLVLPPANRGYIPYSLAFSGNVDKEHQIFLDRLAREGDRGLFPDQAGADAIPPSLLTHIEQQLNELAGLSDKITIVLPPQRAGYRTTAVLGSYLANRGFKVQSYLLDPGHGTRPDIAALYADPSLWFDENHLSTAGAVLWSQMLATDMTTTTGASRAVR